MGVGSSSSQNWSPRIQSLETQRLQNQRLENQRLENQSLQTQSLQNQSPPSQSSQTKGECPETATLQSQNQLKRNLINRRSRSLRLKQQRLSVMRLQGQRAKSKRAKTQRRKSRRKRSQNPVLVSKARVPGSHLLTARASNSDFRVKFGVPLEQVCKNDDIPGPLLVLILKLNKEGPSKKDVFRAPGHQGSMKKLIHFLHNGRLVNIDNFSVYTIASVLKKFLRKLPEGIFGRSGEEELFNMIQLSDTEQQRDLVHRLIVSRPKVTQHLLVLLFGTFRVIANSSGRSNTGMTSEALGVSVAPSFFRSCVAHGKTATMDDVLRFKVATQIMQFMIDNFGVSNLFGRENYEYYARITGRVLRVEEDWIFAYRYPRDSLVAPMAGQEESQSTPALIHIPEGSPVSSPECGAAGGQEGGSGTSLRVTVPENNLRESCTRLSISLEENGLYKVHERQTERMRTRSEWFLTPQQCGGEREGDTEATEEGYLPVSMAPCPLAPHHTVLYTRHKETLAAARSDECKLLRRSSSKDKERRLVRRSSSKKDKENGQKKRDALRARSSSAEVKGHPLQQTGSASPLQSLPPGMMQHAGSPPLQPLQTQNVIYPPVVTRPLLHQHSHDFLLGSPGRRSGGPGLLRPVGGVDPSPGDPCCSGQQPSGGRSVGRPLTELDCTETDVQTVHVSNTYKPRI